MRTFAASVDEVVGSKTLYPAPISLGTQQARFHATMWGAICEHLDSFHGKMLVGRDLALFTDRRDQRAFAKFWSRYERWFPSPSDYRRALIPAPPTRVLGSRPAAFVADAMPAVDLRIYCWNGTLEDEPGALMQRIEGDAPWLSMLPVWMWFPMRCRDPVYRINGGWLFTNANDAAKWTLFAEERAELVAKRNSVGGRP